MRRSAAGSAPARRRNERAACGPSPHPNPLPRAGEGARPGSDRHLRGPETGKGTERRPPLPFPRPPGKRRTGARLPFALLSAPAGESWREDGPSPSFLSRLDGRDNELEPPFASPGGRGLGEGGPSGLRSLSGTSGRGLGGPPAFAPFLPRPEAATNWSCPSLPLPPRRERVGVRVRPPPQRP